MKQMAGRVAYVVGHNGLGDNITCIGAVRFLVGYYDTVFFVCKKQYESNVQLFFTDLDSVRIVPILSHDEHIGIAKLLAPLQENPAVDIFIGGSCHTRRHRTRIGHTLLLDRPQNDKNYTTPFKHIQQFYYDFKLDLSVYFENFFIPSTERSLALADQLSGYEHVIFCHTKSSDREISTSTLEAKYGANTNNIIICANKNVYDRDDVRHSLAQEYIQLPIALYIDVISIASTEIYVIDSCFSCAIHPLQTMGRLRAVNVTIVSR